MNIFSALIILKIISAAVVGGFLIFLFLASFSIYTNLTTGVPWAKIPGENIDKIFQEINLPKNSLIYDLGAGDGRVVFMAAELGYRAIGYELSLYPYLKAIFKKAATRSPAMFKRRDFLKEDLSRADAVFVFLVGKVMDKVARKLKQELKAGAVVVCYGFGLPGWQIEKTIITKPSLTYLYKT